MDTTESPPLMELTDRWREDADALERCGHPQEAEGLRRRAEEAEEAHRAFWRFPLTVEEAADWSGYSEDHLRRLVRSGPLRNVGTDHRIQVRRCELPRKPGQGLVDRDRGKPRGSRWSIARSVIESVD